MAALDLDEAGLALVAEVAAAAGLLAVGGELDEAWLPTTAYDGWLGQDVAERWADLVEAWLATTRVPGLAGRTDDRGRTMSLLGPELDRSVAPQLRRAALDELAAAPAGAAASTESILARLRWQAPRRGGRLRDDLVTASLARGGDARPGRPRRAGRSRARAARRRRRRRGPQPHRPAAGAAGPRPAAGRPDRGGARPACGATSRPGCGWLPTWSPPAAPPSTGSATPRCGAPSTPAGRPPIC